MQKEQNQEYVVFEWSLRGIIGAPTITFGMPLIYPKLFLGKILVLEKRNSSSNMVLVLPILFPKPQQKWQTWKNKIL